MNNKQQAEARLKELEAEREELLKVVNNNPSPEERFLGIINGAVIRVDKEKYPDSVFIMTPDGKYLFEIEENRVWCGYYKVWGIFEKEYAMDNSQIKLFIKNQMEDDFKINCRASYIRSDLIAGTVEDYFKMK